MDRAAGAATITARGDPLAASDNPGLGGEGSSLEALRPTLHEAVRQLPPEVGLRAQNSLDGFERAKRLIDIDLEMASFRAITAEEEAAAALFRSMQIRGYPGADRLSLKMHQHKAALQFYLEAVRHAIVGNGKLDITLTLRADPPSLTVALPVAQFIGLPDTPENLHIVMVDPLGMVGTKEGEDATAFFDAAIGKVAGERNVDKLIAKAANARNNLLYAHDSGLPESRATASSIEARKVRSEVVLMLAIAVLQVTHQQPFAEQCLAGFLKIVGRAKVDVFT